MDDFEFQDWYEFHVDNEPECDSQDFPDDIGQDMSEYDGDLTPSEGDYSDIFDPGDEIVDDDGEWFVVCDPFNEIVKIEDNEDREDSGCP